MHLNSVDDYSSAAAIALLLQAIESRGVRDLRDARADESFTLRRRARESLSSYGVSNLTQMRDGLTYVGVGRSLRSSFSISGSASYRITILYSAVHPSVGYKFSFSFRGTRVRFISPVSRRGAV